jgi:hypothetical protein
LFADKLGDLLHDEHADEFGHKFNETVELQHGLILALSGANVKAGKCGCPAVRAK